jgi:hypothetical protein
MNARRYTAAAPENGDARLNSTSSRIFRMTSGIEASSNSV